MTKTIKEIGEEIAVAYPSVAQIADYLRDSGEHDHEHLAEAVVLDECDDDTTEYDD